MAATVIKGILNRPEQGCRHEFSGFPPSIENRKLKNMEFIHEVSQSVSLNASVAHK